MKLIKMLTAFIITVTITACNNTTQKKTIQEDSEKPYTTLGTISILDNEATNLLDANSKIEVLDSGFIWTEGPLWIEADSILLFSDVPSNTIYQWREGRKAEVYLSPSGYTGSEPFDGKEPGSNGLIINNDNRLVLAQHGNHQIAYMNAPLNSPSPTFVPLANNYEEKRLNSPNDLIQDKEGNYYFTDPVYGLADPNDKELAFTGVYKLSTDGQLTLLVDSIVAPNGIALTNDEKHLLVANSDKEKAYLYEFELSPDLNQVVLGRIAYDFTPEGKKSKGLPDGFKIDQKGNIFISGPQGLWILNKEYKPIAQLILPHTISNCWLADNDKTLYITGSDKILRLRLK